MKIFHLYSISIIIILAVAFISNEAQCHNIYKLEKQNQALTDSLKYYKK